MAFVNHALRQVFFKIIYYGPGLSGKTTHLIWIYRQIEPAYRGEMLSLETETDRTLFFDFLPLAAGELNGYHVHFHLYSVPGQVFFNSARKLILKAVDGIVFVADSQAAMRNANIKSLALLHENLADLGISENSLPIVFAHNKRDLVDISTIDEMNSDLNPLLQRRWFESCAIKGANVLQILQHLIDAIVGRFVIESDSVRLDKKLMLRQAQSSAEHAAVEIKLDFDTSSIYEGEWNPISFTLKASGERSEPIQIEFVEGGSYSMRSFVPANTFIIATSQGEIRDVVWVKSKGNLDKILLEYRVGQINRSKPIMVQRPTFWAELYAIEDVELLTFMFVDVVSSTAIWKNKQLAVLLMENLKLLVMGLLGQHGRINKSIGDSFLITFKSPARALATAWRLREMLSDRNKRRTTAPLEIKIGIDLGEVTTRQWELQVDGELFGYPVARAARLCASAGAGEVLISDLVFRIGSESIQDLRLRAIERIVTAKGIGEFTAYAT